MNFPTAFCDVLKKLRTSKGLTQREVAARAAIPEVRVSDFERGERTPSPEQSEKLAAALDVDVCQLTDGTTWLSREERSRLREAGARTRKVFLREYTYRPPRDRSMMFT